MNKAEIEEICRARLKDAKVLLNSKRYDGSVYLCGYAIELGLKARICRTLQWDEYPAKGDQYRSFRTHNLDVLLHLSGIEHKIRLKHFVQWSIVAQWSPESRYNKIGSVGERDANEMLDATKELLGSL